MLSSFGIGVIVGGAFGAVVWFLVPCRYRWQVYAATFALLALAALRA